MKHFYSHLIELDTIFIELEEMDLSETQRHHLAQLVDSALHHTVLDAVLSELNDSEKEEFLRLVSSHKHDKIWEHLNLRVNSIEDKIKLAAEDLKKQLHEDIKEVKRGK